MRHYQRPPTNCWPWPTTTSYGERQHFISTAKHNHSRRDPFFCMGIWLWGWETPSCVRSTIVWRQSSQSLGSPDVQETQAGLLTSHNHGGYDYCAQHPDLFFPLLLLLLRLLFFPSFLRSVPEKHMVSDLSNVHLFCGLRRGAELQLSRQSRAPAPRVGGGCHAVNSVVYTSSSTTVQSRSVRGTIVPLPGSAPM